MRLVSTIFKVVKFVIALGGILIVAGIWATGDQNYMWNDINLVTLGIDLAFVALGISAAAVVVFSIGMFFMNIKKSLNAVISVVLLVILFGVSYSASSGEVHAAWSDLEMATQATSKYVGTGIVLLYILFGAALLSIIGSEVTRFVKFRLVK